MFVFRCRYEADRCWNRHLQKRVSFLYVLFDFRLFCVIHLNHSLYTEDLYLLHAYNNGPFGIWVLLLKGFKVVCLFVCSYKGFKGNCSTSFIDQFKALHQCNRFCELLGLTSLQPKPKRTAPPNPKAQPAARKKPFGSNVKGKSWLDAGA